MPRFRPHDEETKRKISEAQKGKPCPQRGRKGRVISDELRQKIKEGVRALGKEKLSERSKKSHTVETDKARSISFQQHKQRILELAEQYRDEGYEVLTELDLRPDLIIRKNGEFIAVEVQRGRPKGNYKNQKVFDKVLWIEL